MTTSEDKTKEAFEKMRARGFSPVNSIMDLPHVTCGECHGRGFHLHSFFDKENGWFSWLHKDGQLIPTASVPVEAMYYSKVPEDGDDLYFSFLDFIHQVAAWKEPSHLSHGIESDLHNLGACIEKLRLLHKHLPQKRRSARLAATEIEYVIMVCRSMLDLLQETISSLWKIVFLTDTTIKKRQLKKSFAGMVFANMARQTSSEIETRFGIPSCFAEAYAESGEFFAWLRGYRDSVIHGGKSLDLIFVLESGFGVSAARPPFSQLPIWSDKNTVTNDIGSVHSAVCYVVGTTLSIFDRFTDLLVTKIKWPPPFASECRLFVRGPHIGELKKLQEGVECSPWYVHDESDSNAQA